MSKLELKLWSELSSWSITRLDFSPSKEDCSVSEEENDVNSIFYITFYNFSQLSMLINNSVRKINRNS